MTKLAHQFIVYAFATSCCLRSTSLSNSKWAIYIHFVQIHLDTSRMPGGQTLLPPVFG